MNKDLFKEVDNLQESNEKIPANPLSLQKMHPFISKFIHELKTPIHGISGISEYLQNHWDELNDESKKKCIKSICSASQDLIELISFLPGKIANKMVFDFVEIDIIDYINLSIEKCKSLHIVNPKIEFKNEGFEKKLMIKADKFWFIQLMVNILSNAIQYSNNAKVVINLKTVTIEGKKKCIVSIKDNGSGINEDEIEAIFSPFKKGSKNHEYKAGMGLGLAICREIVTAHGGEIRIFNNKDIGSTVEFFIMNL